MSSLTGDSLPVASSARHKERLASLAGLGVAAALVFGASAVDGYVSASDEPAQPGLAAAQRAQPEASRSQPVETTTSGAPSTVPPSSSAPTTQVFPSSTPAPPAVSPPMVDTRDPLLARVGGAPMFPLSSTGVLTSWKPGAPVEVHNARVQAVTSGGFWIGETEEQRVFVTVPNSAVNQGSLAPFNLRANMVVNLSGRASDLPENEGALGLSPQSRVQLETQGRLVDANSVRFPASK